MSRLELKRKIAKIWPATLRNRKIIFLYHSVGNTSWGMAPSDFYDQINWLSDHCRILSLTQLIESKLTDDLQVAITFDDGYVSLHDTVAPLALEKKISPMVYINTGWMGESEIQRKSSKAELGHYPDESFLTWQEVKKLRDAGWEIGSHGVNHYNFAKMQNDMMNQELTQSKNDIEMQLQSQCLHFAYPWGKHSIAVKNAAKLAGYQYAAAVRHAPLNNSADLFALPRINVAKNYSFEDFKNIVRGKWDYLGLVHKIKGL